MGILVHKYGGTSVASTDKIKNIAKKIVAEKEKGHDQTPKRTTGWALISASS